ncbi:hypothetical protein RP20_CCG027164 [Aedes albopictus]|nr:hypothetical protein RP20_CCG027164 [Aedes albopictus]
MTTEATGSVPSTECTTKRNPLDSSIAVTDSMMTSTAEVPIPSSISSTTSHSRRPTARATTRTTRTAWRTTSSGHITNLEISLPVLVELFCRFLNSVAPTHHLIPFRHHHSSRLIIHFVQIVAEPFVPKAFPN